MFNFSLSRLLTSLPCQVILGVTLLLTETVSKAQISLLDQPLYTSIAVPGNVLLSLSVEYPTALSWAYPYSTNPYTPATTYLGYFDPAKCYVYNYAPSNGQAAYFQSKTLASATHACTSSASTPLWSGNWLNWASMQTIDTFRWALTGGLRGSISNPNPDDTPTMTVLERAWASGQGGSGETPNKTIPKSGNPTSDVSGATPFNWSSVTSRVWGAGNMIFVTGTGSLGTSTNTTGSGTTAYTGQSSYGTGASLANAATVYALKVRVKVCDPTVSLESNCTQYGSNYKPEGLMQKYAMSIRFGAFGYLNDGSINRDGGVLRANMKYIGPMQPVPGSTSINNTYPEWSATDGTFYVNPNPADATNSGVTNSGVINYLNKFGQSAQTYKVYDPVGELYYAGIRYFKNLGNWSTYTSNATTTMVDGFPVITAWNDPIIYSCQKNFILGIGDVNTHADANLPGSNITSSYETATRPTDTTVNVQTATNMVGTLEGMGNIGQSFIPGGDNTTYFMAGLAYDSHVRDIRPNDFKNADGTKTQIQTISTYWVDVWENQVTRYNSQYYLATKYGGFNYPSNFQPYASTNATGTLTLGSGVTTPLTASMWHTNSDSIVANEGPTNGTNLRPDNYFNGGQADKMVSGLTNAFSSIVNNITASTTAFSYTSPQLQSSNNLSYSSKYASTTWTGDVVASTVSFDAGGNPSFAQQWSAQSLLTSTSSRKIVTCCSAAGAAFPFQVTNFNSSNPANYATFNNVPGVAAGSQSASNFLAYLRGNQTLEVSQTNGVYRTRAALLGDIVDSPVTPLGPPSSAFSDSFNPGYSSFKTTYANRKTVVYAGANDGMLHAFDGSLTGGTELFAYVPSFMYGTATSAPINGLASLGNPNFTHHFFVDGMQQAFDIDMSKTYNSGSTTPAWKTVLIGGLGKGGKGYYAIDVTDPTTWTSEAAVASKVLWEFSDSRMGYSYGNPTVVKTAKYGWVVVFTSGYNNADGIGYLFFVNPKTGQLLEAVSTGTGSVTNQSGLTYASAYVASYSDDTADSIYAGDLLGNIWRVDLTTTSGAYAAPKKVAVLTDPSGIPQPVTTQPLIEIQPNTFKRYILVGTGRLISATDISSTQVQSFYAIVDGTSGNFYTSSTLPSGVTFPISRTNLVADTNLLNGIGTSPSSPMGWYIDLGVSSSNGVASRVDVSPTAVNSGLVGFSANLPNGDVCNPSGTSQIYAINFGTGASVLTNSNGNLVSSIYSSGTIVNNAFLNVNGNIYLQVGKSNGDNQNAGGPGNSASTVKRLNWRELPTAD